MFVQAPGRACFFTIAKIADNAMDQ